MFTGISISYDVAKKYYGDYSQIAKNPIKTKESSILPESYEYLKKGGYLYYKGELLSPYELIEEAVRTKAITLHENMTSAQARAAADKALIYDRAAPRYGWSNTLYSEDVMEYFNKIKSSNDWHKLLEDYRPEAFR